MGNTERASVEPASTSGTAEDSLLMQTSSLIQLAKATLLYKRFRVVLKDGRVLTGDFHCMDREGNVVLGNSYVHLKGGQGTHEDRRMGLVLIPPSHRVSVEVEAMPREVESLQQLLKPQAA